MITSNSYFGMTGPTLPEIRPSVSRLQNQSVTFGDRDLSKAIAGKHQSQPKGLSELWDFFRFNGKILTNKAANGSSALSTSLEPLGKVEGIF